MKRLRKPKNLCLHLKRTSLGNGVMLCECGQTIRDLDRSVSSFSMKKGLPDRKARSKKGKIQFLTVQV